MIELFAQHTGTGLPFDRTGPVDVTGALAPVWCGVEHRSSVYTEPKIFMRQRM